jgi:AraC-like DNA-binding protein
VSGPPAGADAGRRAIDFIMGRLGEPLSVSSIASASGVSVRTFHRIIRRDHGVSPMVLLRRVRLAKARHELLAPGPATTVTRTALHWGFGHLGRFSRDYARHFGESPSDTLRLARRGLAGLASEARAVFRSTGGAIASDGGHLEVHARRAGCARQPAPYNW